MNSQELWEKVIDRAKEMEFEIHTVSKRNRTAKWFLVGTDEKVLIIDNAKVNRPSVELNTIRRIGYNDFDVVCQYYIRWLGNETGIRREVTGRSRNTAYIFAIISEMHR